MTLPLFFFFLLIWGSYQHFKINNFNMHEACLLDIKTLSKKIERMEFSKIYRLWKMLCWGKCIWNTLRHFFPLVIFKKYENALFVQSQYMSKLCYFKIFIHNPIIEFYVHFEIFCLLKIDMSKWWVHLCALVPFSSSEMILELCFIYCIPT